MALKNGSRARLIQPVIEGEIVESKANAAGDGFDRLLEYKQGEETHRRWFADAELKDVPDAK